MAQQSLFWQSVHIGYDYVSRCSSLGLWNCSCDRITDSVNTDTLQTHTHMHHQYEHMTKLSANHVHWYMMQDRTN